MALIYSRALCPETCLLPRGFRLIPGPVAISPRRDSMLKRAAITFTELALWFVVLAMLVSGFTRPASGKERRTARNETTHAQATSKQSNHNSMSKIPLVPRDVLFGNPQKAQARLSHDGK